MNRGEAIAFAEQKGSIFEKKKCVHFANVSHTTNKSVWWLDIPISKIVDGICTNLSIILHNAEERSLMVLEVPIKEMKEHLSEFSTRTHKDIEFISLELTLDSIKDVRPKGSNIAFKQYVNNTYETI